MKFKRVKIKNNICNNCDSNLEVCNKSKIACCPECTHKSELWLEVQEDKDLIKEIFNGGFVSALTLFVKQNGL